MMLCIVWRVYGRFPDGYFPRMVFFPERRFLESRFPDGHFPGWDVSWKDFVNGIMVGLMFRIEVDAEVLQNDHTAYI